MNTSNALQPVSSSIVDPRLSGASPETRQLVSLGEARGWDFRVLGRAPMLEEPVRLGDWLLVPAEEDSTPIPARTMERIQAIFAAGIRPQGFVMVHEAPKLLKAPAEPKQMPPPQISQPAGTATTPHSVSDAFAVLGAGMSILALLFFPVLIMAAAMAGIDPILCAVSESGEWIEIDRWWTENT